MTRVPSLYDPAEDLLSEDCIALFVAEALETGDAAYIANARCCRCPREAPAHDETWAG